MDRVTFKINDVWHSVGNEITSDVSLLDYIRNYAELRGTKYMCREGGCGACIVSAVKASGEPTTAVNSCLVAVTSCLGWDITTVEKVGNRLDGYHRVQKTLAEHHGSQCGYCSPGWVMAMYSLLQQKGELTMLEIEKSFGSNVCRCTGYRPILDAFKTFAKDSPTSLNLPDIEDLKICKTSGKPCENRESSWDDNWCIVTKEGDVESNILMLNLKDGRKWFRARIIPDIFAILIEEGSDSYMLVHGNTAKGAYPIEILPRILIDISRVHDLREVVLDQNLVVGAGLTLTEFIDLCNHMSQQDYFEYLTKLRDHLELVAHIPVRNLGSIGGNLMIKHQHNDFPSDVFLLFETVGAEIVLLNEVGFREVLTLHEFLATDMRGKLILNILLPPLNNEYHLVTYKIMPRAQSAHAIVNAGFLYKLYNATVIEARIVYGGLSPEFIRAFATENDLVAKDLFTNDTLQSAIQCLIRELVVIENPPEPSAVYRKQLAVNLFYKGLLSICPQNLVDDRYKSGMKKIRQIRPVSIAQQIYETDPKLWPLNQPVPKLEALIQCSGEAPYTEDIPATLNEVFASFVLSKVAVGTIASIEPSQALEQPGVIAFYTAKDIPGDNSFTAPGNFFYIANEEVLSSGNVTYYNQPIAIVVAETRALAEQATKLVKVKYINVMKPVIDVKEAKTDPKKNTPFLATKAKSKGIDIQKVIIGDNTTYGQYHFMMETLVTVTKPTEEGMEVHSSTQWMDGVQMMIGRALKMDRNRIDVHVRRLGGGYGIKISRAAQSAVACALVTKFLNRPCRFIQSLTTNMRAVGKRFACAVDFEVAVNKSGVIQSCNYEMYEDNGFMLNETLHVFAQDAYYNCYDNNRWSFKGFNTTTNTAKNTFCRSPGTIEAIANAENIMEQISYAMDLDPFDVRLNNLDKIRFADMKEVSESLKMTSDYEKRKDGVDKFNKDNRWKKRGLRCAFLRWTPVGTQYFVVNLSVYHDDGTVAITHCGIEMGQGVNTKAAQIAAYILKIPIAKIQIKGTNTVILPNGFISGGSITSQNVGLGVQRACEQLLKRLEPIRANMNDPTWEVLVKAAFNANIDLQTHGFTNDTDMQVYHIYGATLVEVEVDILTGEFEIIRVDLVQDAGRTVSPEIDIGQVEGAFIMGLGYWTCEELVYNHKTGELLTDRSWNYNVPQARDIPQDFRVRFRKNGYSNDIILGAKGTGEPSICMSIAVPFAIRKAIAAAREEIGIPTTDWFQIDGPYTLEKIYLATVTKIKDLRYTP